MTSPVHYGASAARLPGRFWEKVEVANGCWLWVASTSTNGYGMFKWCGRLRAAHRLTYGALVGPIPDGLELDHICCVRNCVNPEHLEPVTHLENVRRGKSGSRQAARTHCPQGHPYDEGNTYVRKTGSRSCRECDRARVRRRRERERRELR